MKASPFVLLYRYHQRARWSGALWVAVAGLTLDFNLARWDVEPQVRGWALALTVCFALWARVRQRESLRSTARILDAQLVS